ncbi:MAG: hypothetical protein HRF50_06985 [Phycisphaerae bacterium]
MFTLRSLGALSALAAATLLTSTFALAQETTIQGEPLDPADFGPQIIEDWATVVARDAQRREAEASIVGPASPQFGEWAIPSPRAADRPHSGKLYVVNKNGATEMGIGFPSPVTVHGAFFVGQGAAGVRATCLRALGYRAGELVALSDWATDIGETPTWVSLELVAVDRIVIEAAPVYGNAAWYGMDDLTYSPVDDAGAPSGPMIVVDFEDATYKQTLTGGDYAGLIWETGPEGFVQPPEIVPAPVMQKKSPQSADESTIEDSAGAVRGGLGTLPTLQRNFQGVIRGDAGSMSAPPDTCGAIGPNHFVVVVNRNVGIYTRDGVELSNVASTSFLPGSNGDPRVCYDQFSGRWIIHITDFNTRVYLAVSLTDDPTGGWFKTSFVVSAGSDAGCWPDYPTLGYDANGIYVTSYMVGCNMSIFALDKAPLIAPSPSLGTVTAFRNLPYEGAIQPVFTHGSPAGEYFVSANGSTTLRVRRVNPPLTAPTLTDLGNITVPSYTDPPDAPALGSSTPLDSVDDRIMNAVYRDGYIYAAHCIGASGRAAARWYQIQVSPLSLVQSGTVSSTTLYYLDPSICVNSQGDLAMGFSGSNASQYAGAYYTGRVATDPPGEMATPVLLKAGQAPHNILDGFGRNRWGDYSLTTLDPLDELKIWTIQEYVEATDIWGTWVAEMELTRPALFINLLSPPPAKIAPGAGASFDVEILPGDENLVPSSLLLAYRFDGGSYQTTPLVPLGGANYQAVLPPVACDDVPEFYITASGDGGTTLTLPEDAPSVVFSAAVGVDVIYLDDPVETDLGWSVGAADDTATTGIWNRGDPEGTVNSGEPVQTGDDHTASGVNCWATDTRAGSSAGVYDVDGGKTTLYSPVIDLAGNDANISYWRWYSNHAGSGPHADTFVVDVANDGASWVNVETVGPAGVEAEGGWYYHEFRVSDKVTPTATVQLRFVASDYSDPSLIEAAVDDFLVADFVCATDCPGDLNGDGAIDLADLSALLTNFGGSGGAAQGDLDGDGDVDLADLSAMLERFGTFCR